MIYLLLVLIAIYLYLILPTINRVDFTPFMNIDYAHRGLHDNQSSAPENSLSAIREAVNKCYGIEFDVQLSRDKNAVVFHDFCLDRACNIDKRVDECDYDDLKTRKLFNSEEGIPLLSDVLNTVNGKVPLIVELKASDNHVSILCENVAKQLDEYTGLFVVESFNPFVVKWFRDNRPDYIRGQLSGNFNGDPSIVKLGLKYLLFNAMSRPDFIAYNHNYKNNISLRIIKSLFKIPLVAYTVKHQKSYNENSGFFDLIIFEGFIPKN